VEGCVVEFAKECYQFFTNELKLFKKGACGILINEISVWIKTLMVKQCMFPRSVELESNPCKEGGGMVGGVSVISH
jgi:hypothetical protein